jgi:hypothetical protein
MKRASVLVMGDSFMSRDPEYPGQHWSELMTQWQVENVSRAGYSNALIALTVLEYIEHTRPDAVVIGFTDCLRLEFAAQGRHGPGNSWITSAHDPVLTADERLARDYFRVTRDLWMEVNKSAMLIGNVLMTLRNLNIPFAFSWMMFDDFLEQIVPVQRLQFRQFEQQRITYNLATENRHCWGISSPRYHVNDHNAQQRFAKEAHLVLTNQLCIK